MQKQDFPGPLGDTLFAMNVGDVSAPVKSQFGYHILKLEQIQAGEAKPFADVRTELDSQYRQDRAAELFGERQEDTGRAAREGHDRHRPARARTSAMTRGSVPEFLRGGGAEPLGSSVDLQQTVFSDATLNQGKIGGPVGLGDDRLVVVKVTSHHKAAVKPLDVVRDEIVALLKQERGVAAAKAAAEAALAKLAAGEKLEMLAKALNVSAEPARFVSRGDPSIPAALRTAIFEAPRPTDKPVIKTATLDDGSTAVFVVTRTRVARHHHQSDAGPAAERAASAAFGAGRSGRVHQRSQAQSQDRQEPERLRVTPDGSGWHGFETGSWFFLRS